MRHTDKPGVWERGGKKSVLETYEKLHEGKIGAHWLWVAVERIASGESEVDVLRDYGYVPHKKTTFHTPRSSVFTKGGPGETPPSTLPNKNGFDRWIKKQPAGVAACDHVAFGRQVWAAATRAEHKRTKVDILPGLKSRASREL